MKKCKIVAARLLCALLLFVCAASPLRPVRAAERPADIQQAAALLRGKGVYKGDASGDLKLDKGLTRAELAAILTRLNKEVTDPSVFTSFCYFPDVPDWAKPYVGYCVSWLLMRGYDSAHFGPNDSVDPRMACTVVLRSCGYDHDEGSEWTYATASQYAASLGWIDPSTANAAAITRGEMAVLLCRASGWSEAAKQAQATTTVPASQKAFEITPDGQYIVHADHWSREDFSQQADPAVFTGVYTRELYNAIRQTLVDGDAGDQPAFTVVLPDNMSKVERILAHMDGGFCYDKFGPPNFVNHIEHTKYFAVSSYIPDSYKAPLAFIQPIAKYVDTLTSDREKVTYLNDYLCSLMTYDYEDHGFADVTEIFASHAKEVSGDCGSYANAMQLLCQTVGIPCIIISSIEGDHIWNMVYADGRWLHVDVSANDTNRRDLILLKETYPASGYPDSYPEVTAFIKELLVPGSSGK